MQTSTISQGPSSNTVWSNFKAPCRAGGRVQVSSLQQSHSWCYIPPLTFCPSATVSLRLMRSWARQRLVAASSLRTDEKVASRKGSGRLCRSASRARLLSLSLLPDQFSCADTVLRRSDLPEKASHDMLEKPNCLHLDQPNHHIT